jgi:hypothetical protein
MSEALPNDPQNRKGPPNVPAEGGPDSEEHISRGAHGRYGIEEESNDPPLESHVPKTRDEIERDAARDAEVRNTGEDLGGE